MSTLWGFPRVGLGWGTELHGVLEAKGKRIRGSSLLQVIYNKVFSSCSARCQEKQQESISLGIVFVPSSVSVRMKLSSALDMPQPVPRLGLIPCTTRDDS